MESFADHPQSGLCYTIFITATFTSGVIILNMSIGLMGDTLERVIEEKDLKSIATKINIISD